jgi:hypothetical protein
MVNRIVREEAEEECIASRCDGIAIIGEGGRAAILANEGSSAAGTVVDPQHIQVGFCSES